MRALCVKAALSDTKCRDMHVFAAPHLGSVFAPERGMQSPSPAIAAERTTKIVPARTTSSRSRVAHAALTRYSATLSAGTTAEISPCDRAFLCAHRFRTV